MIDKKYIFDGAGFSEDYLRCKKTPRIKISERDIQKSIIEYLSYKKNIYFFRAGSGAVKLDSGRYFKTGRAGCPDIVVCHNGKFVGLEVKTSTGKVSPAQNEAQSQIMGAGGEYHIVRSLEDVKKII